jgi:pimeloyl-ACP methyl ester carboxylesterase
MTPTFVSTTGGEKWRPAAAPGGAFKPHTVEADGFTVRYFEAGSGDPIVRIHGAGGPLFSYALDDLATTNRIVELELPGFGQSPLNEAHHR